MSAPESRAIGPRPITVALVNNMPDAAFVDTEQQFCSAVAADSGGGDIEMRLYAIDEVQRSEQTRAVIAENYRDLDELWAAPPDALIITGTEPVQTQLPYESYWPVLARLIEWAATSVPTTMLSCLAAHASTLIFDGIERTPLEAKCCGVFSGALGSREHALSAGLPESVPVPHSRVNDISEAEMVEAGYDIIVGSDGDRAGWAVAARNQGDALLVLCQAHPEYSTLSLLREYRRDVRRFLLGRGALPYPRLPEGYLRPEGAEVLERFAQAAEAGAQLWEGFPLEEAAAAIDNTWQTPSMTLYRNWLGLARQAPASSSTARA
jgi:homoserine O-succinyltransferase